MNENFLYFSRVVKREKEQKGIQNNTHLLCLVSEKRSEWKSFEIFSFFHPYTCLVDLSLNLPKKVEKVINKNTIFHFQYHHRLLLIRPFFCLFSQLPIQPQQSTAHNKAIKNETNRSFFFLRLSSLLLMLMLMVF